MHPDTIRAEAAAQLAILRADPRPRCRCGAHTDDPRCHARPLVIHDSGWPSAPPTATTTPGPPELVAVPLEVWAAQHPT